MMNPSDTKYIHSSDVHNTDAAREMVPYFMELLRPTSVIDIGCGLGTFAQVFREHGITDVMGVDGEWVNRELLLLDESSFMEADLEKPLQIGRRFDLAVCLEVVEHLRPEAAETIVRSLTELSDMIVFSAAVPMQGGQNHINEQWPAYWANLFATYNYRFCDVLRQEFWDNQHIEWWYKQNIFLVVKAGVRPELEAGALIDKIHPELFLTVAQQRSKLLEQQEQLGYLINGRYRLRDYFSLLIRAFKVRMGF